MDIETIEENEEIEEVEDIDILVHISSILNNNKNKIPKFCFLFLEKLNKYIEKSCIHKWIDDYIDIKQGEESQPIRYCQTCYLTKEIEGGDPKDPI